MTGLNIVEGLVILLMAELGFQNMVDQLQNGFSTLRIYVIIAFKIPESIAMVLIQAILKKAAEVGTIKNDAFVRRFGICMSALLAVGDQSDDKFYAGYHPAHAVGGPCVYRLLRLLLLPDEADPPGAGIYGAAKPAFGKNCLAAKESYGSNARLYYDMGNHFFMLRNYLADGKVEEAREYLEKLDGGREAYSVQRWTGIEAVDYILSQKMEAARQHHIETEIQGEYPRNCGIDPVDLCTILTNLLDNGIEACKRQPEGQERRLRATLHRIHQFILIRVENTAGEAPRVRNSSLVTSKKDMASHGWGIRNVRAAVEKYQGTMEHDYRDGLFTVNVMLFYQ